MAEEKDTDPAPDEGLTESDSGTPENDRLDALDDREDEFDGSDAEDESGDEDGEDGDRELVAVGAAAKSRTAGDAVDSATTSKASGSGRKGRATAKQRARKEPSGRGGPISFVQGSVSELKKVVYPTWPQLLNYFVVVLVFVLIIIAIVAGLDYGIGWVMLRVFS